MKKRSLAILAGGMSLALLLSSCGPSSAPTESPSSALLMKPDSRRLRSL